MKSPDNSSYLESSVRRVLAGLFGGIIVMAAIWFLICVGATERPISLVGAALLLLVGLEAITSAIRKKLSWLERIGPLP